MLKHTTGHRNITLSLSQQVITELHLFVQKRGISRFVEDAITEKLQTRKLSSEQRYITAAKDEQRNRIFAETEGAVGDGLNEQNDW